MTTMPRDSRCAAIPSLRCAQSLDTQQVVPAAALKELESRPSISSRRAGSGADSGRRTAKGTTFMTLEDETGTANLIVWPHVWERFRRIGRQARAVIATGLLQRQEGVIHLIVDRLQDLTKQLPALGRVEGLSLTRLTYQFRTRATSSPHQPETPARGPSGRSEIRSLSGQNVGRRDAADRDTVDHHRNILSGLIDMFDVYPPTAGAE